MKRTTITTVHVENCPECGYPETIIIRDATTMSPLYAKCSSHPGCTFRQSLTHLKPPRKTK
jgi:hypothetical protein